MFFSNKEQWIKVTFMMEDGVTIEPRLLTEDEVKKSLLESKNDKNEGDYGAVSLSLIINDKQIDLEDMSDKDILDYEFNSGDELTLKEDCYGASSHSEMGESLETIVTFRKVIL